jgi:hypothetical protein
MTIDKAGSFAALISAFVCSSLFLMTATSLTLPI